MHINDLGVLRANGIVVGAAFASKYKDNGLVPVASFVHGSTHIVELVSGYGMRGVIGDKMDVVAVHKTAAAARERSLSLTDFEGVTVTASSLGTFGVDFFPSIINPPNTAAQILGAVRDRLHSPEQLLTHPGSGDPT